MSRASHLVAALGGLGILCLYRDARAEPGELHLGGAAGWSMLSVARDDGTSAVEQGVEGALTGRFGLTDAFDLTLASGAAYYPAPRALAPWVATGITYIIDTSRWIPHVGADVGFTDILVVSCPDDPARCIELPKFTLGIPAGLEYRITEDGTLGVRFRFALGVPAPIVTQIFLGAYGAFSN